MNRQQTPRNHTAAEAAIQSLATPYNWGKEADAGVEYLRGFIEKSGQQIFVMGLSGGIDSAVAATLAYRAVGKKRLLLVAMPYGHDKAPKFHASHGSSLECAIKVRDCLSGVMMITDDITTAVDTLAGEAFALSEGIGKWETDPLTVVGNIKARVRAVKIRAYANMYKGLVLGTENLTENLMGYFTIGGDEETDLEVLSPYLKTQVRALARELGVCADVIDKHPSADLWAGQTDEDEMGFTYNEADLVLNLTVRGLERGEVARKLAGTISKEVVDKVFARMDATGFKRAGKQAFGGVFTARAQEAPATERQVSP